MRLDWRRSRRSTLGVVWPDVVRARVITAVEKNVAAISKATDVNLLIVFIQISFYWFMFTGRNHAGILDAEEGSAV